MRRDEESEGFVGEGEHLQSFDSCLGQKSRQKSLRQEGESKKEGEDCIVGLQAIVMIRRNDSFHSRQREDVE